MTVHDLQRILATQPFFAELPERYLELLAGCAKNARFEAGEPLVQEGDEANDFFVLRRGRVAIEMQAHDTPRIVTTLDPGQVLGWSWLVPPHYWHFDARALDRVHVIALDGQCLRGKCETDRELGFEMLRRFGHDMEQRLYRAWTQLADLYAPPGGSR